MSQVHQNKPMETCRSEQEKVQALLEAYEASCEAHDIPPTPEGFIWKNLRRLEQ